MRHLKDDKILMTSLQGKRDQHRPSAYDWPRQQRPNAHSWKLWKICYTHFIALRIVPSFALHSAFDDGPLAPRFFIDISTPLSKKKCINKNIQLLLNGLHLRLTANSFRFNRLPDRTQYSDHYSCFKLLLRLRRLYTVITPINK